jgi:hypothetical protein
VPFASASVVDVRRNAEQDSTPPPLSDKKVGDFSFKPPLIVV